MVKVWAQVGPKAIFGDCLERIQNSGRLQRPGPPEITVDRHLTRLCNPREWADMSNFYMYVYIIGYIHTYIYIYIYTWARLSEASNLCHLLPVRFFFPARGASWVVLFSYQEACPWETSSEVKLKVPGAHLGRFLTAKDASACGTCTGSSRTALGRACSVRN